MRFRRKVEKELKKLLRVLEIIFLVFIIGIPVFAPFYNNCVAKSTADDLSDISLPKNTEFLEKAYLAGKLIGNGNGMQYFGAILIKSALPLEELKEYYSENADNDWECIVEQQDSKEVMMIEHGSLTFDSDVQGEGYYIVYSWGSNHTIFDEFDLRGY